MSHTTALVVKALMVAGTLLLALRIMGARPTAAAVFTATAVLVGVGYPLGDLYLLQTRGNAVALALDAALALGVLWAVGAAMPAADITAPALIVGTAALALGEWFLHRWLERQVGLRAHPGELGPHEKDE